MKTVILCGGYGSRLSEETKIKPKQMVKVGKEPILEHIINIYSITWPVSSTVSSKFFVAGNVLQSEPSKTSVLYELTNSSKYHDDVS